MFNLKNEAKRFLSYHVGCNSRLMLWHDPWINHQPLVSLLSNDIVSLSDSFNLAPICSIISNRAWKPSSSNHVLVMELRRLLQGVRIFSRDEVLWNGNAKASIPVIWDSCRRIGIRPPWFDAVWHSWHIPKCSFIFWLMLQNRLLTRDKLLNFGLNVDPSCVLCRSQPESNVHIGSECLFTSMVLKSCPVPVSFSWNEWQAGFFTRGRTSRVKSQFAWLYVGVVLYLIWRERNNRIHHNGGSCHVDSLIVSVKRMVREKASTLASLKKEISRDPTLVTFLY
ncbi:uncharacterized protein LOC141701316 [Apium graveolens]|uniref:uncharacterized protein LOC141701316 n=1 Tax=Apium graveolens TaxID=4045 RepID=UPI003D7905FA